MAELIRKDGGKVTAYQDAVMCKFAFNGRDGVVSEVGEQCALDVTVQNKVTVKSGMIVIQGRQVVLTGNDTLILETPAGNKYKVLIYLEVDMAANTATLKKFEQTDKYPVVPNSDDLNALPTGKAYLGLYKLENSDTGVSSIVRIFDMPSMLLNKIFDFSKEGGKTLWDSPIKPASKQSYLMEIEYNNRKYSLIGTYKDDNQYIDGYHIDASTYEVALEDLAQNWLTFSLLISKTSSLKMMVTSSFFVKYSREAPHVVEVESSSGKYEAKLLALYSIY